MATLKSKFLSVALLYVSVALGSGWGAGIKEALSLLESADGETLDYEIASQIDALFPLEDSPKRDLGGRLRRLLAYSAQVYQDRDPHESQRIRSYLALRMAEYGFGIHAAPYFRDILSHLDDSLNSFEVAAVVSGIGYLGKEGIEFIPLILRTVHLDQASYPLSISRYAPDYPREEATSVQKEALKTLQRISLGRNETVLGAIRQITRKGVRNQYPTDFVAECEKAVTSLESMDPSPQIGKAADTSIFGAMEESPAPGLGIDRYKDMLYLDQDSKKGELSDIIDRPTALTFFYTRCKNYTKCSATVIHLAKLQNLLRSNELEGKVRILAITYDPDLDTPSELNSYGSDRGFRTSIDSRLLIIKDVRTLLKELRHPASFNGGRIAEHGVELYLLDGGGKVARRYHTALWDNDEVAETLKRLTKQESTE